MTKRAIWVLENVDKRLNFYSSVNILLLLSSVINWKRWNNTETELYVDQLTYTCLQRLGVLHLWDRVDTLILEQPTTINKVSFWSSSKLRVLLQQEEPVIMVDYDFITFTNISELDHHVNFVYSHDEDGDFAYPGASDALIRRAEKIPDFLKRSISNDAINVSYLCFNDLEFQHEYAKLSLDAMEGLSDLGAPKGYYVCFAEQKILKQLALERGVEHRPLIKNQFHTAKGIWHTDRFIENGFWYIKELWNKFIHYGQDKHSIVKSGPEMKFLCNSVKSAIDSDTLNKILSL